ncbi:unnamed protein product [Dovyalis caffra]|uniref:Uncharacterized protein n=1 Tax=Dovyalis caffra TaxID=77055 RepID=A0AAV1SPT2_9ROSI|nr:unnamed protein product [Dovyalis caffra]
MDFLERLEDPRHGRGISKKGWDILNMGDNPRIGMDFMFHPGDSCEVGSVEDGISRQPSSMKRISGIVGLSRGSSAVQRTLSSLTIQG